jgi:hypothetical protein
MSKLTYAALDKGIDAGVKKLEAVVDSFCDRIRTDHIIPFCQKKKLNFLAGMGGWTFYYARHRDRTKGTYILGIMDVEKVPESLRALLEVPYPLNSNTNDLGSLTQDYRYQFVTGDEVIITVDTGYTVAMVGSSITPDLRAKVLGKVGVVGNIVHLHQPLPPGDVSVKEMIVLYPGGEYITVPTSMLTLY